MRIETIHPQDFIQAVGPALRSDSPREIRSVIDARWTNQQLLELLRGQHSEARALLCICLGMIGERTHVSPLAELLHEADENVRQMAEFALWSIWFRSGNKRSLSVFNQAMEDMEKGDHRGARDKLHEIVHNDEAFAEAYNQCAIAHLMLGEIQEALIDCNKALDQIPEHFGALTNKGHCYSQMGEFEKARQAYRRALEVYPAMEEARQALDAVNELYPPDQSDPSGQN